MNLLTISFKNIQRKPLRTFIFFFVFTVGILSVLTLYYVSRDIGHSLEEKLLRFGANVVIWPQSEQHNISYGGVQLGSLSYQVSYLDEEQIKSAVNSIHYRENISAIAPKLIEIGKHGDKNFVLVGVDWSAEFLINYTWELDMDTIENAGIYTAAGADIAQTLNLSVGDTIDVTGSTLTIQTILPATGEDADHLIFTNLANLQQITGKIGKVNFVEVAALCSGCPIEDIVAGIQENAPDTNVKALQSIVNQRMYTVNFVEKLVFCVILIIIVAASGMMAFFMLAAVNERRKEIGIMRAVGFSKGAIFTAVCAEAVFIAIFSAIAGFIGSTILSSYILKTMDIPAHFSSGFPAEGILMTMAAAILIAILSAAFPAIKAASLNPSEALNRL